jgi:hypothetical protein
MFRRLRSSDKSDTSTYKYPVYKPDDKPQRFTSRMLDDMNLDQLLEELKELCDIKD